MIALLLALLAPVVADETPVRDVLRETLASASRPAELAAGGEPLFTGETVSAFYAERGYRPVWSRDGELASSAGELVRVLRASDASGLEPELYHLNRLEAGVEGAGAFWADPPALASLDLLLTDAFFLYASHVVDGRVDPASLAPRWRVAPARRGQLETLLAEVAAGRDVGEALASLEPKAEDYARLKRALARYRELDAQGGWPTVPEGPKLELGASGERVLALAARLRVTGDLEESAAAVSSFDERLVEAVKRFQARQGLDPDGVVGKRTLEALNLPASHRVREIELALERWRWLREDLGPRYVVVNIPFFDLELVEGGRPKLEMKVVVGRTVRKTPVFSAKMTHLVLSPTWYVPPTIAREDVLPGVKKDPSYLQKKNLRVFDGTGPDARELDPLAIDWSQVRADALPYYFRQGPGPSNPLGRVKFKAPNPYDVCLHDTPSRELFARAERTASSGCIRLEKPLELAEELLGPDWPPERIAEAVEKGQELTVPLPSPIDVHIIYVTSRVANDGTIAFRRDVYGRDARLDAALQSMASSRRS